MTPGINESIARIVAFGSDLITLVLGAITLWTIVRHRKRISILVSVFLASFHNERVKRIKETLGKLDSLNFEDKRDRREIIALFGQVSGQIKHLINDRNNLKPIHDELLVLLENPVRIGEPVKRRIVYELHGELDRASFAETQRLAEKQT